MNRKESNIISTRIRSLIKTWTFKRIQEFQFLAKVEIDGQTYTVKMRGEHLDCIVD